MEKAIGFPPLMCDNPEILILGTAALNSLKKASELPIILEVEPPLDTLKQRRIGFYMRNGFHIETENPSILNSSHTYKDYFLMLMASDPIANCEDCQRKVVDVVYSGMHNY